MTRRHHIEMELDRRAIVVERLCVSTVILDENLPGTATSSQLIDQRNPGSKHPQLSLKRIDPAGKYTRMMHQFGLLLAAYLAFAGNNFAPLPLNSSLWSEFKQNHSKSYESEQVDELRRVIFAQNLKQISEFNERPEAEFFQLNLNHLADLSSMEIKERNGFKPARDKRGQLKQLRNTRRASRFLKAILEDDSREVPDAIDWREVPGRVSEVKNQGQCGSCWAFSATGALEGQEAVRGVLNGQGDTLNKSLIELSEQNLVDCVKEDAGCNGGLMADAFDFIKQESGIDSEAAYPYEGRNGKCRFNKANSVLTDAGHVILPEGDEQQLKQVVAKFGPVAVAIDASSIWFQLYHKGVYVNKHCHNKLNQLDHGVLVVGYGTDPKKGDYWLVKNSWGKHWGEKGYIRMARNRKNQCGIATSATLPTF